MTKSVDGASLKVVPESAESSDSEVVQRPRRSRDSDASDSDDCVICAICKRKEPESVRDKVIFWVGCDKCDK